MNRLWMAAIALGGCLAGLAPAAASARPIDPPVARAARLPACTIVGTQGADVLTGTPGPDVICARGGDDVVRGGGGDDVIFGGPGNDRLAGGAGDDRLYGWRGADRLFGDSGDDFLQGGPDADRLAGGPGTDTADYSTRHGSLHVTLGRGADDGLRGEGDDVRGDVEIVRAGSGDDVLVGTGRANGLYGGAGRDLLRGRGGRDTLAGGRGVDTIVCGRRGSARVLAGARDHLHGCRRPTPQPGHPGAVIRLSNASVAENQPAGTLVGTLSARGYHRPRFALAGGPDDASFAISGNRLVTGAVFDFETRSEYTVGIRVTARHRRPSARVFTITVTDVNEPPAVNSAPVAAGGAVTLDEDHPTVVNLGALASDAETSDANLTYTIVGAPAHGTLTGAGPAPTYTPAANYHGSDSFTYKVTDRGAPDGCTGAPPACAAPLSSATQTVSLTVNPVNDAPVAANPSLSVDEDGTLPVSLSATDVETSPANLTYAIVSGPAHGTLTGAGAARTYTPDPDYNGPDTITYRVTDRGDPDNCGAPGPGCTAPASSTGTITLAVNPVDDAPVLTLPAGPVAATPGAGTALSGLSVSDIDADPGDVQLVLSVLHGTLTVDTAVLGGVSPLQVAGDGTGQVTITAPQLSIRTTLNSADGVSYHAAAAGPDTLSATVDDLGHTGSGGPLSDAGTVAIVVDSPPVAADQNVTTDEDTAKAITLAATDADGDPLTFAIVSGPAHGTLTGAGAARTYTPDPDYNGPDSFTFKANDGHVDSAPATVSITVNPVNDAPVLAGTEVAALAYTENDPATQVTATTTVSDVDSANFDTGTLTADFSAGGTSDDRLEIATAGPIATAGANVTFNGTTIGTFAGGTGTTPLVVTLNANADAAATQALERAITYRNVSDSPATAGRTVRFVLTDGDGGTSAPATRAVTVTAVDDAPALAGIEAAPLAYTESVDAAPAQTAVTGALTVGDVDDANLAGAVVQITGNCQPGEDVLVFTDQNGITGTYTAATCRLVLTGSASPANYQAALRSVRYEDTSDTPDTSTRTVTFTANDGTLDSNSQTRDVTVAAANDSPVAGADTYSGTNSALAGVTLAVGTTAEPNVAVAGGLLANDSDPDTPKADLTASAPATTAHGGTVTVNADGTFSYTPAPGFTGTDTFTYTVHDHGTPDRTATATVTINVAGPRVWFVDPSAAAGGDGTSRAPLNSLAPLSTGGASDSLDGTGDVIFVYQGNAAASGFVLEAGQRLVGQPQGLSVTDSLARNLTLVPAGGANPQILGGLTLADGNTVQRVDVIGSSVTGTGVNTLTYGANTVITGGGLALTGGNGAVSVGAHIATTAGHSVSIANRTGGTTTLSGQVDDTGTGISLTSNTGAAVAFTGTITAGTFSATGGGTVTATGTGSKLDAAATALTVSNTGIGAAGLTFRSITSNGAANGIVLDNTGSAGGLTVTGAGSVAQGGDSSGGVIQNTTGTGVSLADTSAVSLNNMRIANTAGGPGISGTGVKGFSFTNGTVTNSGFDGTNTTVCATAPATAHCPFDSNIALNSNGATVDNVDGAVTIANDVLSNAYQFGVDILNNSGTISNLDISDNAITSPTAAADSAGSGLRVQALGSAGGAASIAKGTLNGNTIQNFPNGGGIVVQGGNTSSAGAPGGSFGTGTGANAVQIDGNLIRGQSAAVPLATNCILVTMPGHGTGFIDVSGNGTAANPLAFNRGNCVSLNVTGAYHMTASVTNNVVKPQSQNSGAFGIAGGTDKQVLADTSTADSAVLNLTATGNTVTSTTGVGIYFLANSQGTLNARIQNNTAGPPTDTTVARPGIRVDSGTSSGTAVNTTVCLQVANNTATGSSNGAFQFDGIALRKQGDVPTTNVFGLVGLTSAPATDAQMQSYVRGQNPAEVQGDAAGGALINSHAGSPWTSCTLPF
jgi:large repetitive protein